MQRPQSGAAVLGLLHGEAGPPQQLGDEAADIGVIVDHQHARRVHTLLILDPGPVPYQTGRH